MTGPGIRTKIVLALLAVTALSGIAAGTSSATSTTAFTCAGTSGGGGFSDSHCVNKVTDGASFFHSGFTGSTALTVTNAGTPATFKANIFGVETSFVCTTVTGTGTIENFPGSLTVEMSAKGTGELTFSGCSFEQIPGCTISGGSFTTKPLSFGTAGTMTMTVFPTTGTVLAEVAVDGCGSPSLNRTWLIEGTVTFAPHGTTLTSTHAEVTGQNSLTLDGHKAGLTSSFVISGPSGAGFAFTT